MTHLLTPKELKQKMQQAKWIAYGYAWAKRDITANVDRDLKAITNSTMSLFEAFRELHRKYSSLNDQGGK